VERVLAQSEHSRVYLARTHDGGLVVLKELLFSNVPSAHAIAIFERECSLLQTLDHPRVPSLRGHFQEGCGSGTRLYAAQEHVAGESLLDRIQAAPLPESEVLRIGLQVLEILEYLHTRTPKVLHRDIKPANLIIDASGAVHLVDFGSARLLEAHETHRGTYVGTFGYMPLEQLGGTVDESADLHALGATLVHLLTGRHPAELLSPEMQLVLPERLPITAETRAWLARLVAPRKLRLRSAADSRTALLAPSPVGGGQRRRLRVRLLVGLALVTAVTASALLAVSERHESPVPAVSPAVASIPPAPASKSIVYDDSHALPTAPFHIQIIDGPRAPTNLNRSCLTVQLGELYDFQFFSETVIPTSAWRTSLALFLFVRESVGVSNPCEGPGLSFEVETTDGRRIPGELVVHDHQPDLIVFPLPDGVSTDSIAFVRNGVVTGHLKLDVKLHDARLE
jgi:serine/threonine protein kinase